MARSDIEEESLSDEIEDDESEPNGNHDVQTIQDVQDERNVNICNMEGKEEKLPRPEKVAITDEKVLKSRKNRTLRGLDDHLLSLILKIQYVIK